jgi:hypothetical protein
VRAETIDWKPWWPRWISVDWGFEHPAAAYWHAALPPGAGIVPNSCHSEGGFRPTNLSSCEGIAESEAEERSLVGPAGKGGGGSLGMTPQDRNATADPSPGRNRRPQDADPGRVVTYREYVTHRTPPRELAREILARSLQSSGDREKIDAIYLSPDAFARRTDEASIAEQMGDVFVAVGLPRPTLADDDRVGGWMLMYQMLDAGEWLLTENCIELIRTLPNLVRDTARVEDVEKVDGDDPADAARYGLKSRFGSGHAGSFRSRMPLADRLAARQLSADPTVRAIQARKAQLEEQRRVQPVSFLHRRR